MSYLIRCVLAKPRLILDEMCRLYGKFASYVRRVLFFLVQMALMRLLDLRLDYKAIFTLEMYYILLSFVDCAPRPYHGGFTLLLVPKIM